MASFLEDGASGTRRDVAEPWLREGEQGRMRRRTRRALPVSRAPKDHINRGILQDLFLVSPFYWALESECEILMFMWYFRPLVSGLPSAVGVYMYIYICISLSNSLSLSLCLCLSVHI